MSGVSEVVGELLREAGEGVARMAVARIPGVGGEVAGVGLHALFEVLSKVVGSGRKTIEQLISEIDPVAADIDVSAYEEEARAERARERPEKA